MKKYIWKFALTLFIYCVSQYIVYPTWFDGVIYFVLMGILVKDDVLKIWREVICEEV